MIGVAAWIATVADGTPFVTAENLPNYRHRIEFWAILGCLLLFGLLIELIRRHQLQERYSLLWFVTVAVLLAFTLKREWLGAVSALLGIYYPPNALFLMLVFFMLLILFNFSMVVSRLLNDRKGLTQQVGLLESRIADLEKRLNPASDNASKKG